MTSLIKPNKISNQLDHTYASLKPILKTDKLYQMHFIELPKQSFHHHDDLFDINLTLSQLDLPKSTLLPRPKISYLHNQEIDSVSHEIQSSLNLEQIYFQQPSLQLNGNYGSYRNIISNQFIDIVWNTNANIDISSSHRKVVLLTKLLCSYQSPNSVNNIALQEDTKVRNDMHISEVPKIKLLIQIENHKAQKLTSLFNFCIKKKFCGFHANHSEENGRQSSSISSYPIDDKSLLKLSPKLSMNNVLLYNVLPQQLLFSMNHLDSKFISFHHSESLDFNKFTTLSFDNTLSCISYQHNNIKYINFLRNLHMKSSKFQPAALSQDENLINIQHRKELNIPEFRYLCHKAEKLNEFVFIEKFKKSTTKDHNINELDINEIMKKLPLNCLQQIFNSFYNISHHHQYPKELVYNDPNLDLSAFGYIQKNKLPEIHDNNHTQHQSNDKANEIKITKYFDYLSYPPIRRILSKMISIRASTPKLKEKMNIPFINTCIIPSFNIVEKRLSLINNYSGQKKNQYRKQHKENINIDDYIISLTTQNISYKLHFLNIMNPRNDRQKDNHSSASPLVKNEIMFNNIPQIPKLDNTIHKLGCINEFNHHLKHIQHIHENNQNNEENLLTALIFTKFEEITKFYIDRIFYINNFGNTFHNIFTDLSENEEINLNNLNLTKICQTKFVYNCLGTIPKRYHNLCIFDKNYRKEIPRMKKKDLSFGTYACENGLLGFTLNFSYIQFNKLIKPLISYSNKVLHIDDNEVINEDYNLDGMKLPIELEVNKSVVSIIKFNKLTKLYAKQLLPQSIKIEKDTGELDSDSLPSVELIKCQYLVPNRKTILNNYTQSIPQNISNAIAVHDIDDVIPRFHCQVNISEMKSNKFDRYRYLKNFAPSTNQISNRTKAYSCKDRDQQNEYLPYFSFDDLLPMKNLTVLPIKLYSKSNKSPIKSREFSGNQIDEYKIQNQLKWNITSISTTRVKIAKLQNLKPKNNTYKINDYIDLNKEYDEECDYILVHSTLSISNSFHNDNNIKLNKLFAFLPNKDKSKCNTINDNFTIYKTFNSAFSFLPKVNLSFLEELNIIYHRAKTIKSKEPNKLDINSSQLLDNFLKKEIPHLINHLNLSPCTSIKTNKFIFSSEKLPSAKLRNISYLLPNKQKSLLLYTSTDSIKSQKDIEDLQQKFMCNLSYDIFFQPKTVSSIEFYYPIHQNRLHEINNENVILCVDVNEPSIYIPKNNKMKALYTFQSSNFHEEERSKDTIDTIYHYGNIYETKTHLFDDNVSINNQHVSINNINFQINNRFDSLNNINKFTKSIFLNKITNESENDLNLTPLPNLNYSFALHNKERPLLDSFFLPVILSPTSVDEQSTFTNLDSTIDELMSTKKAFLIPRYVNNIDYLNNYHFWNDSLEILKDINQSDFAELKHTIFIDKAIFNKVTKILILLRNYYYEKQSVNINGYHQISKQENQSNSFNENDLMPMFEFIDIHDNLSKGLEYVNVYNTTNKTNQVAIDALLKPKENLNVSKIVYSKIVKTKFISNFHATPSTFKSHISSPNDLTFCFNLNFDIFFSNNKFNIPNPITLDHRIDISSFHFPTKAPEIIVMKKFHQIQKLVSFNKPGIKFVNETLSKIDLIHTTSSFSDNWHLSIQKYQLVDLNSYLSKRLPHFGFSHKTNEAGKDKIDSIIFNPKITFSDSIVVSNQINQTKYISNFQYNDSIITPKENISNSTHEMFCFDLNFDLILSTFKIRIPDSIELNHEINANDFLFTPKPPQINFVKKSNKMNNLISFTKTETKLNKEIYDEEALSRIQFFDETSLIPDITSEYRVEVKMNSLFYLMNVRRHKMPELYDKDRINSEVLAQIDDSLFGFIKKAITTKNFTTSSDEGPNYIFTSSEPEMPIRSPRSRRRPFNPTDKVNNQQFVKVIDLLKNKTQSSTDASDASLFDNSSEGSQSPRSKKKQSPAFNIHRRNSSHSLQSDSVPFDEEEDGFY
ncbi:hypothetical protein TRFO_37023 [Tritrichomonas foetus]|uniref:Uncharacterized protein n=1 Tax=Tritrichomonas foetus TaxID=1144522 RepID=A0A1J4JDL4_9EUKA|nr:hypothetical protein TRFO_37023 [Tritrichomonas foetus]|eukprot:OHS96745.1 hypothetical protein TRFO_37023 [Tritrichomonas foetus]